MVKIYVLINPINNDIIYVGCTIVKLDIRLKAHARDAIGTTFKFYLQYSSITNERKQLIKILYENGYPIIIKLIDTVPFDQVDYFEKFYYEKFKLEGHSCMQASNRFTSQSFRNRPKVSKENNVINNQQPHIRSLRKPIITINLSV